jgi:hypothetical protein
MNLAVELFFLFFSFSAFAQSKLLNLHPLNRTVTNYLDKLANESFDIHLSNHELLSEILLFPTASFDENMAIQDYIENEHQFYSALKYSIENRIENIFLMLLNWSRPFSEITIFHIDYFVLVCLANIENASNRDLWIEKLFNEDLRSPSVRNLDLSLIHFTAFKEQIGTITLVSLDAFMSHLFYNPSSVIRSYSSFRKYLHLVHLKLQLTHVDGPNFLYLHLFHAFDLIVGFMPPDDSSLNEDVLRILTEIDIEKNRKYNSPLHEIAQIRISEAFVHFFKIKSPDNLLFLKSWNFSCDSFLDSFYLAYLENGLTDAVFHAMFYTPKFNYQFNLKHLLYKNPLLGEPLKFYSFVQKLILKFLQKALEDHEKQEITNYFDIIADDELISFTPFALNVITENYSLSLDWDFVDDLKSIPNCFDEAGGVHFLILWILAHVPKLFSKLDASVISKNTITDLFSNSKYLTPTSNFIFRVELPIFQVRLFSLFDLKTQGLKTLLEFPGWNKNAIENFFKAIRAETDFRLISSLNDFNPSNRHVRIVKVKSNQTRFLVYQIFKRTCACDSISNYRETLVLKGILSIY